MRIVTDGELYAVEKGWLFKRYASRYSWFSFSESSSYSCWMSLDQAKELYHWLNRKDNLRPITQEEWNQR